MAVGAGVARWAVAGGLSILRQSAFSLPALVPPTGGRLLVQLAVLANEALRTLAAVGGASGHTQTVHTPEGERGRGREREKERWEREGERGERDGGEKE